MYVLRLNKYDKNVYIYIYVCVYVYVCVMYFKYNIYLENNYRT